MQQGIPSGEEDAAGQALQELEVVEAEAGEKVPAGHCLHASDPTLLLYFPASHAVHIAPFDPV